MLENKTWSPLQNKLISPWKKTSRDFGEVLHYWKETCVKNKGQSGETVSFSSVKLGELSSGGSGWVGTPRVSEALFYPSDFWTVSSGK